MIRTIAFYLFPGHQMLDLSGPLCAFQVAGRLATGDPYRLSLLSSYGGEVPNSLGFSLQTRPSKGEKPDTLLVAGGDIASALQPCETAAVRKLAARSRRVASVCTGAFLLAAAGLLDGRRATTHWRYAPRLRQDYPAIQVDSDRIYIRDGHFWTSAGITSGIDLALALIEEDLGPEISRAVARELVVYHRRPGGQSQFSTLAELAPDSDRIRLCLSFARERLAEDLSIERLAASARLSIRQFGRIFKQETGETPAKAIERIRAEVARDRVENTTEPVETIAAAVGFHDPERLRRAFLRLYGHSPQTLRRQARLPA